MPRDVSPSSSRESLRCNLARPQTKAKRTLAEAKARFTVERGVFDGGRGFVRTPCTLRYAGDAAGVPWWAKVRRGNESSPTQKENRVDLDQVVPQFERFSGGGRGAGWTSLSPRPLRWRPQPGKWSALEILVHLLDEEREDFRPRLLSTLEDPTAPWPSIDPEAWVTERDYQSRDREEVLRAFREERARSVQVLAGLRAAPWDHAYAHPTGEIRAGDLLRSWLSHDALHLRQLAQRSYQRIGATCAPYLADYAGPW